MWDRHTTVLTLTWPGRPRGGLAEYVVKQTVIDHQPALLVTGLDLQAKALPPRNKHDRPAEPGRRKMYVVFGSASQTVVLTGEYENHRRPGTNKKRARRFRETLTRVQWHPLPATAGR